MRERLLGAGIPIQEPVDGHAVFVDAARFVPHSVPERFPAQSLAVELFRDGEVRWVEVGSLRLGRDPETGEQLPPEFEFLRLAVPRRVYTHRHLGVVAAALARVWERREEIQGMEFTYEPEVLRHFAARFRPAGG